MQCNPLSKVPYQKPEGDAYLVIQLHELEQMFCIVMYQAMDIVKKLEGQLTRN